MSDNILRLVGIILGGIILIIGCIPAILQFVLSNKDTYSDKLFFKRLTEAITVAILIFLIFVAFSFIF